MPFYRKGIKDYEAGRYGREFLSLLKNAGISTNIQFLKCLKCICPVVLGTSVLLRYINHHILNFVLTSEH